MQLKLPVRNRGYARALEEIGEILQEVEAAKEKKKPPPRRKDREKEDLEKELEEDLRKIGEEEDDNTPKKNDRPR